MRVMTAVLAGLLVVALAIGGWFLYWDLSKSAAGHRAHINRSTYEFQTTLRNQLEAELSDIADLNTQTVTATPASKQGLASQRLALTHQICTQSQQLTGGDIPSDIAAFSADHCQSPR